MIGVPLAARAKPDLEIRGKAKVRFPTQDESLGMNADGIVTAFFDKSLGLFWPGARVVVNSQWEPLQRVASIHQIVRVLQSL